MSKPGVAKILADKLTIDELDHLATLQMTSNDEITNKYLGLLQDKYTPDASSNPNLGKGLDNGQKAELGGVDSGTPGGRGPEDEEKGRIFITRSDNHLEKHRRRHQETCHCPVLNNQPPFCFGQP